MAAGFQIKARATVDVPVVFTPSCGELQQAWLCVTMKPVLDTNIKFSIQHSFRCVCMRVLLCTQVSTLWVFPQQRLRKLMSYWSTKTHFKTAQAKNRCHSIWSANVYHSPFFFFTWHHFFCIRPLVTLSQQCFNQRRSAVLNSIWIRCCEVQFSQKGRAPINTHTMFFTAHM